MTRFLEYIVKDFKNKREISLMRIEYRATRYYFTNTRDAINVSDGKVW